MAKQTYDRDTLQAALLGYQTQIVHITSKMDDVQQTLGIKKGSANGTSSAQGGKRATKRHKISAEGRRRIAEAQKKRWAAKHAAEAAAAGSKQAPAPASKKRAKAKTRTAGQAA